MAASAALMVEFGTASFKWTKRARLFGGGFLATVIFLAAVFYGILAVTRQGSALSLAQWAGLAGVTVGGTLVGWFGFVLPSTPVVTAIEVGPARIMLKGEGGKWRTLTLEGPGPILSARPMRSPESNYGLTVMLQIPRARVGGPSISLPISGEAASALSAALSGSGFAPQGTVEFGRTVTSWIRG